MAIRAENSSYDSSSEVIPVFKPLIGGEEIAAAVECLKRGWLGMGSYVGHFETAVAEVCSIEASMDKHVVAVSTGHAALHLALLLLGVGKGDEVITPSFNNAADFQAIKACGADPVFVDVDEQTLCIDVSKIESMISERTKCIIAMDYDVFLCDHAALADLSRTTGIPILHDAAHSFGATYNGVPIGNQHSFTMFSFDPVKTVTCVDGGALIVEGLLMRDRARAARLIGMTQSTDLMYSDSRAWTYDINELGFRYHMSNLHAAIGIVQIKKLDQIRSSRREVCEKYDHALTQLEGIITPNADYESVNPFLYYIRIQNGMRDSFRKHLGKHGIDTGIHWQAGHTFSFFKDTRSGPLTVTEQIVGEIVSLPLHSNMASADVERVIEAVTSFR